MRVSATSQPATASREAAAPAPPREAVARPAPDGFDSSRVRFGDRVLRLAYRLFDRSPLGHRPRAHADAEAAMTEPLVSAARLGDVTVVANGLLNLEAPAATLFRIARYTDGPVVVASNSPAGDPLRLEELREVEGVPVPPELQGRLFAIGDRAPAITPWTDASEQLARQLDTLEARFEGLGEKKVTVLGYSQGALSAMAARQSKPGLIDRVISLSGALEGTPFAANPLLRAALGALDRHDGRRALDENSERGVARERDARELSAQLIDLAYGASADGGGSGVEPLFALTRKLMPEEAGSDGVISTVTPDDARCTVVDSTPKTHLRVWQDFRTIDVLARALPRGW